MVGPQRGKPYGYEPPPLPPSQDLFDDDWPELGEFLVLRPALVMINTFKKKSNLLSTTFISFCHLSPCQNRGKENKKVARREMCVRERMHSCMCMCMHVCLLMCLSVHVCQNKEILGFTLCYHSLAGASKLAASSQRQEDMLVQVDIAVKVKSIQGL